MKELATYLMLQIGGNATPSKEDVTGALGAVGVEVDTASLDKLYADLEGKDIAELIEAGKEQLAKFGGGGGGGGGGGAAAGGDEAAEEEEEEEEEEAEAPAGGGGLFGDDDGGDY
mmetsp:Transcript_15017/g.34662  ORF Transcript_15017/g.34662 Transcript_15017/m.34662 type:complete len:115 (+) Transcript_15017:462-806(+)|eukprot:CAMPEP_0172380098 /NCGR_PEP_ID=MMETSP1060-20121228/70263_1 /TAXON_ID=37318 /ORGANISM="Pseudo-nitzschia pungens, Strain cf. cingulata" /LENGTH=114 /DNA_ID=CAMNT_0013107847 /DNA_START=625 /DNA_END=969 /DNA_ORIENTATION=-